MTVIGSTPGRASVLCLCGSRKPAPDRPEGRSASRELLRYASEGARAAGARVDWLDLRELDLPFWDGRSPEEYGSPDLEELVRRVRAADIIILSVPAYWNGVSGVVKNMLDLLGNGPLQNTWVGTLVVGMDDGSAWNAAAQLRSILAALGAWVPPLQFVVGDPRQVGEPAALIRAARKFGAYMVMVGSGYAGPNAVPGPANITAPTPGS